MKQLATCAVFLFALIAKSYCQNTDSVKIDYKKLYSYALNADVSTALKLLLPINQEKVSKRDSLFINNFLNRFGFSTDKDSILSQSEMKIDSLLFIYKTYWRKSLLDTSHSYDSSLLNSLSLFLKSYYNLPTNKFKNEDSIDVYLKKYIKQKSLFTTGLTKTGRLYDLLVWEFQNDTAYTFRFRKEKIITRVVLMDNFITLGWEEYATLGKYYPGGWATTESLFCVIKAYDRNSEAFRISYLAHEGRHFLDYLLFPNLTNTELEYRAKLTELSMANESLFKIISGFISNANKNSSGGHPLANYLVIHDLSQQLFHKEFEADINSWKMMGSKKINRASYKLLKLNSHKLQQETLK